MEFVELLESQGWIVETRNKEWCRLTYTTPFPYLEILVCRVFIENKKLQVDIYTRESGLFSQIKDYNKYKYSEITPVDMSLFVKSILF